LKEMVAQADEIAGSMNTRPDDVFNLVVGNIAGMFHPLERAVGGRVHGELCSARVLKRARRFMRGAAKRVRHGNFRVACDFTGMTCGANLVVGARGER
jgi:hypothetical protein